MSTTASVSAIPGLMNLAVELKRLGAVCRTAFFLHLPFPTPDLFLKLPWRERLLAGLLAFDQVGFQTKRDFASFLACVKALAPPAPLQTRAGVFPVGVDAQEIEERASRPEVEARLEALRSSLRGRKLIFGIDSLDRSQGIPEKLRAFAELLTRHPDLQERVTLVQVATPSRESLPRHGALLVNPFDYQGTARVLHRALELKEKPRAARMRKLRAEVRRHDVSWWAGSFLASALAERPERPVTSIRAT